MMLLPLVTSLIIALGSQPVTVTPLQPKDLPAPDAIMAMDSFKRATWCRTLTLVNDQKAITQRLFAPLSATSLEVVRNHLQMKGHKLPSVSGYFHPPRKKISIREVRKENQPLPSVINTLLGAPPYADAQKTRLIGDFIIRGCMLGAVARMKPTWLPEVLHEAAFNTVTLTFRAEIIEALQKSGPAINLYFLPWAERNYNREKHPLKFFKARFALYILNSSVAGNPRIALQSAPFDLKLKLLELYSKHHDAGAIAPILQLCNSEEKELRDAARKYMIRYFAGPPTKTKIGTIKLPGGVEKTAILYLGARQQAYHAVKKALEEATQGDYDRTTSSKALAHQLFRAWDRIRHAKWDILFTKAHEQYQQGFVREAVEKYRKVLAHGPNPRQRELMFPAFMILAREALSQKKMDDALRYIRILSQLAVIPALEADLFYLLGLSEEASGDKVQAIHWYKLAIEKNPSHAWAIAAYHSISPLPLKPVEAWEASLLTGLVLLGLLLLALYGIFRKALA